MVVGVKLALSLLCGMACIGLTTSTYVDKMSRSQFHWLVGLLWFITRLGLYVGTFFVMGMAVTSDVQGFYFPQGEAAALGKVVYRDFTSSYAPGFPYLVAGILKLWWSPKAIVLTTAVLEGVSFATWLAAIHGVWTERIYRRVAVFYALSSFAMLNAGVAGQNQSWVSLCLASAVLLYRRNRQLASAVVLGLPLLLIKFLPLLYLPTILRWKTRPLRTVMAALVLPGSVTLLLLLNGIDVFQPIRLQGSLITSGNLPYLFSAIQSLDGSNGFVLRIAVIAILIALSFYFLLQSVSTDTIVLGMAILTLTCGLLSQKFYTNYLMMVFIPICVVAALQTSSTCSAISFGLFNLLAALEPSLWFRLLHAEEEHSQLWQVLPRIRQNGETASLWVFLTVEVILIAQYGYYLARSFRLLRAGRLEATPAVVAVRIPEVSERFS